MACLDPNTDIETVDLVDQCTSVPTDSHRRSKIMEFIRLGDTRSPLDGSKEGEIHMKLCTLIVSFIVAFCTGCMDQGGLTGDAVHNPEHYEFTVLGYAPDNGRYVQDPKHTTVCFYQKNTGMASALTAYVPCADIGAK